MLQTHHNTDIIKYILPKIEDTDSRCPRPVQLLHNEVIRIVHINTNTTLRITPSLLHSLTHSVDHSLTQSINQSINHSLTHSINRSLTHSITHSLTHSLTHSFTHLLTHSLTHPPIKLTSSLCDENFNGNCIKGTSYTFSVGPRERQ